MQDHLGVIEQILECAGVLMLGLLVFAFAVVTIDRLASLWFREQKRLFRDQEDETICPMCEYEQGVPLSSDDFRIHLLCPRHAESLEQDGRRQA